LALIPKVLRDHIDNAFPEDVCLVGTVLSNGYAQISPRGSVMVFDDERLALWIRGSGSTAADLQDGSKVTVFFRKPLLQKEGILPRGGVARFYGTAEIHKSGSILDEVYERMSEFEQGRDPEKKGYAAIINVERCEDLPGNPLDLE
jgi:general stress protein 26